MVQILGPLQHVETRTSFWLLVSIWPSPGHWETRQDDERLPPLISLKLLQKRVVSPWSIENDPETHTNHQSWKLYLKFEWQKHTGRTALKCIKECTLKALSWGTNFLISFGVLLFLVIPPSEEDLSQPHNRDLLHLILCNHANGILRAEATWWLHWLYTSSSWFLIYEDVVLGMVSNWLISNYHSDLSQQFLVQMS